MNQHQYSSGTCGDCIKVKGRRGTIVAMIVDKCMGCKHGDVDLSSNVSHQAQGLHEGRQGEGGCTCAALRLASRPGRWGRRGAEIGSLPASLPAQHLWLSADQRTGAPLPTPPACPLTRPPCPSRPPPVSCCRA